MTDQKATTVRDIFSAETVARYGEETLKQFLFEAHKAVDGPTIGHWVDAFGHAGRKVLGNDKDDCLAETATLFKEFKSWFVAQPSGTGTPAVIRTNDRAQHVFNEKRN